jgi:putative DNA primase/helicase
MDLNDLARVGQFPTNPADGARMVSDGAANFLPDQQVEARLDGARRWTDGKRGAPKAIPGNIEIILELDPRQCGRFQWNEFSHQLMCDGREITDEDETALAIWMHRIYSLRVSEESVSKIINLVAKRDHRVHPVRSYLDGLVWDKIERLHSLLGAYFEMEKAPQLYQEISKKWLISSVSRIQKPGAKVDTVVILAGKQGIGKSQGLRALCPQPAWFSDSAINLDSKDALLSIHSGILFFEFSELSDLNRKEAEKVKAFISSTKDRFRPPYSRNVVEYKRQLIFTGSTNRYGFLSDKSGARRFWPAKIKRVDLEAIERDRDQLWAEAMALYDAGAEWWLTVEEQREFDRITAQFKESDAWDDLVATWLEAKSNREKFTTADVFKGALDMIPGTIHRGQEMRIGAILQAHGLYRVGRQRQNGQRVMVWSKSPQDGTE